VDSSADIENLTESTKSLVPVIRNAFEIMTIREKATTSGVE
jgi:hypothetical protein